MQKKTTQKIIQIDLTQVEELASNGLTKEQVAHNLAVSERTFYRRDQELNGAISEAYRRGKSKGVKVVANALFEKAKKGDNTAMIFFLKCNGWRENSETTININNTKDIKELSDEELFEIVESSKEKKPS